MAQNDADAAICRKVPKVLRDWVLVLSHEKTKTEGGILIPDTAQKKGTMATVVAAGPGRRSDYADVFHETPVKTGDVVIYNRHARTQNVKIGPKGEEVPHLLIKAEDLLAVVEGEHADRKRVTVGIEV